MISELTTNLTLRPDGIWGNGSNQSLSYPDHGNDWCFRIEDTSFWFAHRNDCITAVLKHYLPLGSVVADVGGGNGFVAKGLMSAGYIPIVIEPGPDGAHNAKRRGLPHVIHSTVEDAGFHPSSLDSIGAFDVIEHIENDLSFVTRLQLLLKPGGLLVVTVPAYNWLWSDADDSAGHFRRYTKKSLSELAIQSGLHVLFLSGIFDFLIPPVFFLRRLPYLLSGKRSKERTLEESRADHSSRNGWGDKVIKQLCQREKNRIVQGKEQRLGASFLMVARG